MKLSTSQRKKFRVRNKLKKYSSTTRYRLTVSRSSKNISAQIIDDLKKITLLSATSNQKSLKGVKKTKSEVSTIVAENLAKTTVNYKWRFSLLPIVFHIPDPAPEIKDS